MCFMVADFTSKWTLKEKIYHPFTKSPKYSANTYIDLLKSSTDAEKRGVK